MYYTNVVLYIFCNVLYRPHVALVRRILSLQILGSLGSICRLFATNRAEEGRAIGRHNVPRETLLRPTLYSLYRCWHRRGHSAEFRECRERPRDVIYCGYVRVTYVCLHLYLYRSYIEIITVRHV